MLRPQSLGERMAIVGQNLRYSAKFLLITVFLTTVCYAQAPTLHEVFAVGAGTAESVMWSADGESLIVGGSAGARLYSANLEFVRALSPDESSLIEQQPALSPDGEQQLVAESITLRLIDSQTNAELRQLTAHPDTINAFAWSADGAYIASASTTLLLFRAADWIDDLSPASTIYLNLEQLELGANAPITGLVWHPTHPLIAAANGELVVIWEIIEENGALTAREIVSQDEFTRAVPLPVVWNPDGTQLAVAGWAAEGVATILDAQTGSTISEFAFGTGYGASESVAWSPDSTQVIVGRALDDLWTWDAATGEQVMQLDYDPDFGDIGYVNTFGWSPDGARIAAQVRDYLIFWDAQTGQPLSRTESLGITSSHAPFEWSPDGRVIVYAASDGLFTLNIDTGETQLITDSAAAFAWSGDSRRIVVLQPPQLLLIDASDGTVVEEWSMESASPPLIWHPARDWLVIGDGDSTPHNSLVASQGG
jgi:WD40 repeat protein